MTTSTKGRRTLLQGAGLAAIIASNPVLMRQALAAEPIKIGIPCALTGSLAVVAEQTKRTALLWARQVNAAGGIHDFFVAGVKRVTLAANFHFNFRQSGTDFKNRPASAGGFGFQIIFWVYIFFHCLRHYHNFTYKANYNKLILA